MPDNIEPPELGRPLDFAIIPVYVTGFMGKKTQNIIYCDHSATTSVLPEVMDEMQRVMREVWGNPSSVHQTGRSAKVELESAREIVADTLHAARNEIIFTSGGTESDNFALRGLAAALQDKGRHLITSRVEHHAVLRTVESLERQGFTVTYLDVDEFGGVTPSAVQDAIRDDTILVSIMHANNEIGTINPIAEIGEIARQHGIAFHTDTVQTYGKLSLDVRELPVDALSVSGHKIYGPKGIGFLFIRKDFDIRPLLTGGAQERNLRAGTENLPAIAGLARAAKISLEQQAEERDRLRQLQSQLESGILESLPGAVIHGHPDNRLPGLTHLGFEDVDGESLVMNLDMRGIMVSSGSACSSGSVNPSHVLLAMGFDRKRAKNAIRISLGRTNTEADIPEILQGLQEETERIRRAVRKRESTRQTMAASH